MDFLKKLKDKLGGTKPAVDAKLDVETVPVSGAVETAPLSEEQLQAVTKTQVILHPAQLVVGSGTTVGRQRDHNEDTLFFMNGLLADEKREQMFGVFVVADGMGGYEYGEVASSIAAKTFSEFVMGKLYAPLFGASNQGLDDSILEIMEDAVKAANKAVVANAPGAGTTLTAALVMGEQVTIAHVGDSRAYFIYPDGRVQQLTQDHSLVQRLQDLGQLTREEAQVDPRRNVLYRALGQAEPFRPDINMFQLPHHGCLLLASDGLWGTVPDLELFQIINSSESPAVACHLLCEAADAAGGPDNSSVILVQYLS